MSQQVGLAAAFWEGTSAEKRQAEAQEQDYSRAQQEEEEMQADLQLRQGL